MRKTASVITVSDKGSQGERVDTSGPAVCEILEREGWKIIYTVIIPDETDMIKRELIKCADELESALVVTTGGTGFSKRDVTPEATKAVISRETLGIPEVMRSESMKVTSYGCLSRGTAGIRGETLIVNLPGSEKAARENLLSVVKPIEHGVKMIQSEGSANCAEAAEAKSNKAPSADIWLKEAKKAPLAGQCGMYLFHNGVVRETAKAQARFNEEKKAVKGMLFSYDKDKVDLAVKRVNKMQGIYYVRVWVNKGELKVGDDLMLALIGGDIRPNVVSALESLIEELKTSCVSEKELY